MEPWVKIATSVLVAHQLNAERAALSTLVLRLEDQAHHAGRYRLQRRLRACYTTLQEASLSELRRVMPVIRLTCARASRRLVLQ